MAEFEGMQKIGSLLFGGAERMRGRAYEEGRLNTAKTEEALATAKSKQLEATARANAQRAGEKFKQNYIATESGKGRDPKEVAIEAEFIGDMLISGSASDYHAAMQGRGEQQEFGFRETLADTDVDAPTRLQAGHAIQGKVSPDLAAVGTHGVVDLTKEDQTLIPGQGKRTTAIENFEYNNALPPEQRGSFAPFVRTDQMVDTTNPRAARNPITGVTTQVVTPDEAAQGEAAVTGAKKTAEEVVKLRKDYPQTKLTLGRMFQDIGAQDQQIAEIGKQRKLWQSFGLGQKIASIPGTDGANIRALVETLQSQLMLNTLISLRAMSKTGGAVGNVSDREGYKMETARVNLSNPDITVGQVLSELDKLSAYNNTLRGLMQTAFEETYDENGEPILARTLPKPGGAAGEGGEDGEFDEFAGMSTADIMIATEQGEMNDAGLVVDKRGWILLESPDGAAWVNPENQNEFEEVVP